MTYSTGYNNDDKNKRVKGETADEGYTQSLYEKTSKILMKLSKKN